MERARTILFQLRDFFLALPPAKRATFLGLSGGVLLATLGLVYWVQAPSYKVLYSRLDAADAGAVVDFPKSEHIPPNGLLLPCLSKLVVKASRLSFPP